MNESDLDRVVAIELQWAIAPWGRAVFRNELGVPFSSSYVVDRVDAPGDVVGYRVHWLVAGEVHLLSLAVHRAQRRRGLGAFLLDDLVDGARRAGAHCVLLEVDAGNEPAIALYQTRGFVETRRRRGYYGAGRDAIAMQLALGRDVS